MELLTHSRSDCFKTCRKKHWFSYELGIRRDVDAKALRMGTAFHSGLEALGNGLSIDAALDLVHQEYAIRPEGFDEMDWLYEEESVVRLVCGYQWRWQDSPLKYIATERQFELPLINPQTGKPSRNFNLAGKIDGIVELEDGRIAVKENKLLGDDIGPDSELWRRMRIDHQISLYVMASRRLGYQVDTVLYDATRKPTIKPTKVPILDDLGVKIVLDSAGNRVKTKDGKFWRQTGDTANGYVVQDRPMLADEWGDKLNEDIGVRPDFYFQRIEVPRIDQDLEEYEADLWDIAKTIRDAQLSGRWFRTVNKQTCSYCPYFDLCANRGFDPNGQLPLGYIRLDNRHPELKESHAGHSSAASEESATAPAF